MAKDVSIEIGFSGGASTGAAIPEAQLEAFTGALEGDRAGWFTLTSTDGAETLVDMSTIVFVRIAARSRSIGFAQA